MRLVGKIIGAGAASYGAILILRYIILGLGDYADKWCDYVEYSDAETFEESFSCAMRAQNDLNKRLFQPFKRAVSIIATR